MAKLNFLERELIEDIFRMGSGYVLDFSNRTFQEFISELINIDIYGKWPDLSKAKILRELLNTETNENVGKVILGLLEYMSFKGMITSEEDKRHFEECKKIGERLIGRTKLTANSGEASYREHPPHKANIDIDRTKILLEKLKRIFTDEVTPQQRGFCFEKYLRELLDEYDLKPRGSFKISGEQIDGSFELDDETYLLEAKWTSKPINKETLVVFDDKVRSKSDFTRGLFISLAPFSVGALETFNHGRTPRIILMTVQELSQMLVSNKIGLDEVLRCKRRALSEEGDCNKPIGEIL